MLCVKCKAVDATIDIRHTAFCDGCFLDQVHHKYRTFITRVGRSLRRTSRVLNTCSTFDNDDGESKMIKIPAAVALSGGSSSRLLAYYVDYDPTNQAAFACPYDYRYFHIVDDTNGPISDAQMDAMRSILEYSPNCKFFLLSHIIFGDVNSATCTLDDVRRSDCVVSESFRQKWKSLMAACPQPHHQREMARELCHLAMILVAYSAFHANLLLTGRNGTRKAVDILADICAARGRELPWRIAHLQWYYPFGLGVSAPLGEILQVEVTHALRLLNLKCHQESCSASSLAAPVNPKEEAMGSHDVHALTRNFISELDQENVATVSTITRTAAKAATEMTPIVDSICGDHKESIDVDVKRPCCALCISPLADDMQGSFCYGCHRLVENLLEDDVSNLAVMLPCHTRQMLSGSSFPDDTMQHIAL